MPYEHNLVLYQTITPLHVGCGQDVGVVDLPVIRERTTGYPFIPGSGIRGAFRAVFEESKPDLARELFGPTADEELEPRYAGCVSVHDAKPLLFPVRSDQHVFLWLTCPHVLQRLSRETDAFQAQGAPPWQPPAAPPQGDQLAGGDFTAAAVFLEELRYSRTGSLDENLTRWLSDLGTRLNLPNLAGRTVLVSDETFAYFVRHATLIQQHNRLTSAKTVEGGALFSVEAVPAETVFYGFFGGTTPRSPEPEGAEQPPRTARQVLQDLKDETRQYLHLGGDEGTGLGLTRVLWVS